MISFKSHVLNMVYVLMDLLVTGVPVRLLHFYHGSVYSVIYGLFTVIYSSLADDNDPTYDQLDWKNSPVTAVGWVSGLSLVCVPLMHLLNWVIYKIEMRILSHSNLGSSKVVSTELSEVRTSELGSRC